MRAVAIRYASVNNWRFLYSCSEVVDCKYTNYVLWM